MTNEDEQKRRRIFWQSLVIAVTIVMTGVVAYGIYLWNTAEVITTSTDDMLSVSPPDESRSVDLVAELLSTAGTADVLVSRGARDLDLSQFDACTVIPDASSWVATNEYRGEMIATAECAEIATSRWLFEVLWDGYRWELFSVSPT